MSTPTFGVPTPPAVAGGKPSADETPLIPGVLPGGLPAREVDPFASEAAGSVAPTSTLTDLLRELAKDVEPAEQTWVVPTRPRWSITYRTDISNAAMEIAKKAARVKGKEDLDGSSLIDELKMGQVLLGQYCVGMFYDGVAVMDDDDNPVTFKSPVLWGIVGAQSVAQAVAKVYGTDGAVVSVGRALMNASGWTDDPDDAEVGPTVR